ncbi:MAG: Hpt domain-containing protein [Chitinispirillales bacterium]|nr:Hpt domain-containing protein [Chitinispirillales bacterium]
MDIEIPVKFKGKEAFYEKMIRLFVKDLPDTWPSFDAMMGNTEEMKTFVHKTKGTAGNLDITEIYQCAAQFETSLRNDEPDADLYQMFVDTCTVLKRSVQTQENGA